MNILNKKLNFRVNGYPIILEQELEESKLKNHKFKKAGFLDRLIIKPSHNEIIWWAKNCELKYLEEKLLENSIFPILDTKAGTQIMYGTSAYLWYKNNILYRFTFQIIQNKMAAQLNLKKLEEELIKNIGDPDIIDRPFISWQTENQKIIIEYPRKEHGYIHLMFT